MTRLVRILSGEEGQGLLEYFVVLLIVFGVMGFFGWAILSAIGVL